MIFGRTFSNLLEIAFDPILTSTLISEIGLQFDKFRLSLSFFSIKVMMASFYLFLASTIPFLLVFFLKSEKNKVCKKGSVLTAVAWKLSVIIFS